MMFRSLFLLTLLAGACSGAPQRSSADRAVAAACRQEVDRVYAAQNRRELSYRCQSRRCRHWPHFQSCAAVVSWVGCSSDLAGGLPISRHTDMKRNGGLKLGFATPANFRLRTLVANQHLGNTHEQNYSNRAKRCAG